MSTIAAADTEVRIGRILADRRRLLPGVRAEVERWRTVDGQLAALAAAVDALRTHATTPAELRENEWVRRSSLGSA